MKLEHTGLNVEDPVGMAAWYRDHLGMEIVKGMAGAPFTQFVRDSSGTMMIEIYRNPPDAVPAYASQDPLILHLAFVSEDPERDCVRLEAVGATTVDDKTLADGSRLVMMRDPWGLAFQLCRRADPLLVS